MSSTWTVLAAAGAGLAAWALLGTRAGATAGMHGVPSSGDPGGSADSGTRPHLSTDQLEVIGTINAQAAKWVQTPEGRGIPLRSLQLVLIANAWGESALGEHVEGGDNNTAVGIFQMGDRPQAAGRLFMDEFGITREQLADDARNTLGILWTLSQEPIALRELREGTLGTAIDAFVRYVERPEHKDEASAARQEWARRYAQVSMTTPTKTYG